MLDTVKLCVPYKDCIINSPEIFSPFVTHSIKRGVKCICNPDKYWMGMGKYFPKLTILKGYDKELNLFIEFSAPKLLFGNNFNELESSDFNKIIDELLDRLMGCDIEISRKNLENAKVESLNKVVDIGETGHRGIVKALDSNNAEHVLITGQNNYGQLGKVVSIHYSKNFDLENTTAICLTKIIEKLDISKRLDIAKTDYRNGGQIIRFHTNSYEVAFYDKVADLKQSIISEKRALENYNLIQQDLLSSLKGREVLRMEVRLNKSRKIKSILEKCKINIDTLSFKNLFNTDISKKILNYFWDEFIEKSIYVVCQSENDNNVILSKCALAGFNQQKALKIAGIMATIKNNGCRYIKKQIKNSNFSRYTKDIELLNLEDNYILKQFRDIRAKLQRMIPLRI